MTQDEAETKWCPFARTLGQPGWAAEGNFASSVNRGPADANDTRCIASACMAWRWVRETYFEDETGKLVDRLTEQGFCGLAGAPQ